MTSDEFLADLAAIYARGPNGEAFGSGRLIAHGLILTAGHVVDHPTREAPMLTGWNVCLVSERSESGVWVDPPHAAELIWRGSGDLDLALLRLVGAPAPAPTVRPIFASWGETGSMDKVEAAGFPQAWRTGADAIRDYKLAGQLRIASQHEPYAWTVSPGDKPDSRDGWKGMSGGAVCKVGPDDQLYVLGVLQSVPANFSGGLLNVARLSAAFVDERFRNELRVSLECEPQLVAWKTRYGLNAPAPAHRRFRSTIPALRNRPFVGRKDLLAEIGASLGDPSRDAVVVLRGSAGVGKSELAQEFARRYQHAYPGGTFFLDGNGQALVIGLARLGQLVFRDFPAELSLEDQGLWTLHALAAAPTLLIYDNVQSEAAVQPWLPLAGMACHVVMTTLLDRWDTGWLALEVKALSRSESVDLIARIAGRALARQYGARLAEIADGLPVQLVPASATLAYEARRGHVDAASLALLAPQARGSFASVYQRLSVPARLLLHAAARLNPQRIPGEELQYHMAEAVGWREREFRDRLNACLDLQVLQGVGELRMHQLFAKFVLATRVSKKVGTSLTDIVRVQAARMIEIAEELVAQPNRADLAALLIVFSPDPRRWCQGDGEVSVADGEVVGHALLEIGAFEVALPWFKRAIAAKEQGDVHGRVDQDSLGSSLHEAGFCLLSMGQFEAALPWAKRAVAAKEQGDVHGRVDQNSLGGSLHIVGDCLSSTGQFDAALPWFKRAVTAREQGDVHGRLDHAGLSVSLHQIGYCLAGAGRFEAALPWFERAIAAKEQGDIHGRVHQDSLGASLHQVGFCLSSMGNFEAALPWFKRAVAATEQGDIHGRVDHARLGSSLHLVGYCLSSMGRFEAALPWFQRAVAAKEQGDIHGRVDHARLASSLHEAGFCLLSTGRFGAALPWFKRAVAAAEQGDIHGRVHQESLGGSLHQVGDCHLSTDQFEAALPWFQRAVVAKEQGDVHGRIDHNSLGISLHQVGFCLSSTGQIEAALLWVKRAVAAKEQGDIHGRVDHDGLGVSLTHVGDCLSSMGQFEAALPWFQRAVAAKEQGDVHGRVDHARLGGSLHLAGFCLLSTGQFEAALPWFVRAVAAAEQGDIHGRVDQNRLGLSLHEVGFCLSSTGQFEAALSWFERAVAAKEQGDIHGRVDQRTIATSLRSWAACLALLGRREEAAALEARASCM